MLYGYTEIKFSPAIQSKPEILSESGVAGFVSYPGCCGKQEKPAESGIDRIKELCTQINLAFVNSKFLSKFSE